MNNRAAVIGMGKSGKAATALLKSRGYDVTTYDEKDGAFPSPFPAFDFIVLSPGVPRAKVNATSPVIGEIELAWRLLPKGAGPILGITGTNGKSTTTALLGHMIPQAFVGGNLGRPFSEACEKVYPVHVVELSSFQLESIVDTPVLGSIILNLTPDHLDRYASQAEYGAAKARIFKNAPKNGWVVVNGDDPAVLELSKPATVPVHRFSLSQPFEFTLNNRALRGDHNRQNAMAAAKCAQLFGLANAQIQAALDTFPGLPHRLELVREVNGVEYINDSKATNVDSSLVALAALKGPIWLIAGGKGKGAPYEPLVTAARGKVAGVLTIGDDAPVVAKAFGGLFTVHPCETLPRAIAEAQKLAKPGDTVLLSPACASYDQFDNFEHRGDTFKRLVNAL
ncbi:MAG: UDP-N-acetylmuramoyl-L-alanine--D-glutamate ligase [Myxococcaceae bacterium]|nr:UDP-N-acetylmuramoyl-L-alanine--D-glutamate ligase [Myxococcaceae bacterium]